MSTVLAQRAINAPPSAVWKVLRGFGLQYLEGFAHTLEGSGPGAVRAFNLPGGHMTEQLVALDDDTRTLHYTILESPWPVRNYRAVIRVSEGETGSLVVWSAEFTPDGPDATTAVRIVEGTFKMNLKALERFLGAG